MNGSPAFSSPFAILYLQLSSRAVPCSALLSPSPNFWVLRARCCTWCGSRELGVGRTPASVSPAESASPWAVSRGWTRAWRPGAVTARGAGSSSELCRDTRRWYCGVGCSLCLSPPPHPEWLGAVAWLEPGQFSLFFPRCTARDGAPGAQLLFGCRVPAPTGFDPQEPKRFPERLFG